MIMDMVDTVVVAAEMTAEAVVVATEEVVVAEAIEEINNIR